MNANSITSRIERNIAEDNTIKGIKNLFSLKKTRALKIKY